MSVNIVEFARAKVYNEAGGSMTLGQMWQRRSTIFVFLRHFACIGCRSVAVQVWGDREKYQKAGAQLVFIGNGDPHFILRFKEELGLGEAPVFTDPSLMSFRAAGFKRGFLVALGPTSISAGIKMGRAGHTQGTYEKAAGDLWQMGGIVAVRPDGKVTYHYISQSLGDYPPEEDVAKDS